MMCAATAGRRGRRVLLVDHYREVGEKIRISGGGRCNFTNLHATHRDFLSQNRDFCRSALARYTPRHFIALVEKHGIAYHEKTLGQLFCDGTSKEILAALVAECAQAKVTILTDCDTFLVSHQQRYTVTCNKGRFTAESLVIATGGLSIPKMGATDFGYRLARQFGLKVRPTRA